MMNNMPVYPTSNMGFLAITMRHKSRNEVTVL